MCFFSIYEAMVKARYIFGTCRASLVRAQTPSDTFYQYFYLWVHSTILSTSSAIPNKWVATEENISVLNLNKIPHVVIFQLNIPVDYFVCNNKYKYDMI